MADLSVMTGQGGTISLGGRTLILSAHTLGDVGLIQEWVKDRLPSPFLLLRQALEELAPIKQSDPEGYEQMRREMMLAAMEDARTPGIKDDRAAARLLASPQGLCFLLWLSLRHQQADVTPEQVSTWLDSEDISQIERKLKQVNRIPAVDRVLQEEGKGPLAQGAAQAPRPG